MSADVLQFDDFVNSSRGLMARPIIPSNQIAYRDMIDSISYSVYKVGSASPPVSGSLVVADVMFNALQSWHKDSTGFTFLWEADGSLWPNENESYRIVVLFITTSALGSLPFILVWQVNAKSPSG